MSSSSESSNPPNKPRVRLRPLTSFEVHTEAGAMLGVFDQVGEMAGMISLVERAPKHSISGTLVVDLPAGFATTSVLGVAFGFSGELADVVKASAQYVEKLQASPAAQEGAK